MKTQFGCSSAMTRELDKKTLRRRQRKTKHQFVNRMTLHWRSSTTSVRREFEDAKRTKFRRRFILVNFVREYVHLGDMNDENLGQPSGIFLVAAEELCSIQYYESFRRSSKKFSKIQNCRKISVFNFNCKGIEECTRMINM